MNIEASKIYYIWHISCWKINIAFLFHLHWSNLHEQWSTWLLSVQLGSSTFLTWTFKYYCSLYNTFCNLLLLSTKQLKQYKNCLRGLKEWYEMKWRKKTKKCPRMSKKQLVILCYWNIYIINPWGKGLLYLSCVDVICIVLAVYYLMWNDQVFVKDGTKYNRHVQFPLIKAFIHIMWPSMK